MQRYCLNYIFIVLATLMCIACRKPVAPQLSVPAGETTDLKNGLPENNQSVDAYFYAYQDEYKFWLYACLREPAGNLMATIDHRTGNFAVDNSRGGNINVQNITFSNKQLEKSFGNNTCYYSMHQSTASADTTPVWNTGANQSFQSLSQPILRNYPSLGGDSLSQRTIHRSQGISFYINSLAQNFDSLLVTITDGYFYPGQTLKRVTPNQVSVTFTPNDLSKLHPSVSEAYVYLEAFNYSWKLHNGKKYIFELVRKRGFTLAVEP